MSDYEAYKEYAKGDDAWFASIAQKLGINVHQASDVYFLRTRSLWNEELERVLVKAFKEGFSFNVCEGATATRKALKEAGFLKGEV
mgnify:CR=1 FL=1